jgi:hypothetical protein
LGITPVTKSELNLFAKRAMLSLFQLVRHAGFRGTVICLDEAEQGLTVDKKKTEKILSMLMSGIAAIVDLSKGSALLVFALTPDLEAKMANFAALQQRIGNPPGESFFDGNTYAPLISLTGQDDPSKELEAIGTKLVNLFYEEIAVPVRVPKDLVIDEVHKKADQIAETNLSAGNKREMVKATCTLLLRIYRTGALEPKASSTDSETSEEDEV